MSLHVGVLDQDESWLKRVKKSILTMAEDTDLDVVVELFSSAKSLKKQDQQTLDALFLDIDLGEEENGIQVAQWVNYHWKDCRIVFLTDDYHYIMEAYSVNHSFFLLKSYFDKYLWFALTRIHDRSERDAVKMVFKTIGMDSQYRMVYLSEILFMERMGRKTRIVCKEKEFFIWENLDDILKRMEQGIFLRCHNSYLVNMLEISSISKEEVICNGGYTIPVSRGYRNIAVETFKETMMKRYSS